MSGMPLSKKTVRVGMTQSVNGVPKVMPPTITQPICWRLSAPVQRRTVAGHGPVGYTTVAAKPDQPSSSFSPIWV